MSVDSARLTVVGTEMEADAARELLSSGEAAP
jgi:hypothetical protein